MLPAVIDLQSSRVDRGVPLSERYERFIGHYLETRNAGQAFRIAFVPDRTMTLAFINQQAQRLLKDPAVRARQRELMDAAATAAMISVRDLLTDVYDIATADPNELISYVIDCCRHCHGVDHKYQWASELEYAQAVQEVMEFNARLPADQMAKQRELPDASGGFGYWPTNEPHPCCPHCFGRGYGHAVARDTTLLSPAARKLYKGVKETKNGLEVQMHDQIAARELLLKVAGVFKEGMTLTPPAPGDDDGREVIPGDVSEADASKRYLKLIQGN